MAFATPQAPVLSVSQLNRQVRLLLEQSIGTVWLEGEISNYSVPFSGHWYFSLKDSEAQVRCAMFKGSNARVRFQPENGQQVLVKAKIGLYEPRGEYQLIVERMLPAGDGAMQLASDQLKMKLAAEGLFSEAAKQPMPSHPQRIGLVTSASGAALHDILSVLKRRAPSIEVIIYPSSVQGELAPGQLIAALNSANQRNEVDLLVLTRGGGSKEDLWCFNDEQLARAVYHSQLPVISAVGHEVDISICDFVADLRAATPSAAAELISQSASTLDDKVTKQKQRLLLAWQQQLRFYQSRSQHLQQRLLAQAPQQKVQQQQQRLDQLTLRLEHSWQARSQGLHNRQQQLQQRLLSSGLPQRIQQLQQVVERLEQRQYAAMDNIEHSALQRFQACVRQLNSLSPLNVLERGYSIVEGKQGVVSSASKLTSGDKISLKFADGERPATID